MPRPAFVGVDVAFARDKVLPISICFWDGGRLVPIPLRQLHVLPPRGSGNAATLDEEIVQRFAEDARSYLMTVCGHLDLQIVRIAIDAPKAPCMPGMTRRAAEQALDAASVSCFATPTAQAFDVIKDKVRRHLAGGGGAPTIPHSNQLWMLVGFALFRELATLAPCLEVFPQATIRAIGGGQRHKSLSGAVVEQLQAAARYTGWPREHADEQLAECVWGSPHDQLDAYLSAWVAALDETKRRPMGIPPDDAIWVPAVDAATDEDRAWTARPVIRAIPRTSARPEHLAMDATRPVLCPGCNSHEFRRWPWGWDAHAAHRCTGLTSTGSEERKAEFKRRFGDRF